MDADQADIEATWIVLETERPATGLAVSPTTTHVTAGAVLAGITADGQRHLLIPLGPGEAARVNTRGRAVHLIRVTVDDTPYLGVACLRPVHFTVFTRFVNELLESIKDSPSPARATADLFDRWRSLFSELAGHGPLTEEQVIGLLGELHTLRELLTAGAPPDLAVWTGPRGDVHDFRTPHWAVEIKATLAREGRILQISSIDQLDAPDDVHLWLIHHQYARDPGGRNLEDAINDVQAAGGSTLALTEALQLNNIDDRTLTALSDHRYRLTRRTVYDVRSNHFPRITRTTFTGGDIPPGTLRLTYAIDLTNQPPYPMDTATITDGFNDIGTDAAHGLGT